MNENFAKSVNPVKWQYRARLNKPSVETLHEVPKCKKHMVKIKSRPQTEMVVKTIVVKNERVGDSTSSRGSIL